MCDSYPEYSTMGANSGMSPLSQDADKMGRAICHAPRSVYQIAKRTHRLRTHFRFYCANLLYIFYHLFYSAAWSPSLLATPHAIPVHTTRSFTRDAGAIPNFTRPAVTRDSWTYPTIRRPTLLASHGEYKAILPQRYQKRWGIPKYTPRYVTSDTGGHTDVY